MRAWAAKAALTPRKTQAGVRIRNGPRRVSITVFIDISLAAGWNSQAHALPEASRPPCDCAMSHPPVGPDGSDGVAGGI